MKEYYENDPDFKAYVDKYAQTYGITPEEALTHEIVRQTYLLYKEDTK